MSKTYQFQDLKVGMDVRAEELSNIYDTFIVLDDAKTVGDNGNYSTEGKIMFIGRKLDETYDKINKKGKSLSVIFNSSLDIEGDVEYCSLYRKKQGGKYGKAL